MNKTIHQNKIHRSFVTVIICVLFTLLCGLLSGCGETSPAIQLSDSELTMYVGDSQMLKYTLADEDADVEWASSDTKIVSVRRGSIKANAEGTATVTATVGSYVAECLVTVLSREVTISQTTATIDLDSGIIRKGAISAKKDEIVLIPINMKDGSLICKGLGNEDWNCSAPHGAGRLMSRKEAFKRLSLDEYRKEMEGIYTTCVDRTTLDEAPMAYKGIDEIISHIGPTAQIVERITPVYNFKAAE